MKAIHSGERNQVGRRLTVLIVALATALALASSAIQLWLEYRALDQAMDAEIERVGIYGPSIAGSVWDFDERQIQRVLDALILLPNVVEVRVTASDTGHRWRAGSNTSEDSVTRSYPLTHAIGGTSKDIGTLTVVYSTDGIRRQIEASAVTVFVSNSLEILIVTVAMLFLTRRLITVRLTRLANKVQAVGPRLFPSRPGAEAGAFAIPPALDELDAIEWALDRTATDLESAVAALTTANSDLLRYRGHLEELVEQRTAELSNARDAAEAASRAKSSFLSSVSHELRTPLNSVLGYAQLFGMDPQLTPNNRENAAQIEMAGKHLLSLVNDILDLARIESGKLEMQVEAVAVDEIIVACRDIIEPAARRNAVSLEIERLSIELLVDRTRMQQVLLNLLSNAIKYNVCGGRVRLRGSAMGDGRYRILISDTGPGISDERRAQLFQPFNRIGAERSSVEGTGIGLVITKSLVETMGGQIGVESQPGAGTTFWVDIPTAQSPTQVER